MDQNVRIELGAGMWNMGVQRSGKRIEKERRKVESVRAELVQYVLL